LARRLGIPCHAVVFETPAEVCRARNRLRAKVVPPKVLTAQLVQRQATFAAWVHHLAFLVAHSDQAILVSDRRCGVSGGPTGAGGFER
jgi:predicted kinase